MKHLEHAEREARTSGVFGAITLESASGSPALVCEAAGAAAPAHYTLREEDGRMFVGLETRDRWLSESVEADVMHTGDSLEELVEEELAELGLSIPELTVQHFRDDSLCYVFRTPLPESSGPEEAASWLLAYEAAFRELGDMSDDEA